MTSGSSPVMSSLPQSETAQQVPVKQGNIFISNTAPKVPFDFARSPEVVEGNQAHLKNPLSSSTWVWSRIEALLPGSRTLPFGWPFRSCVELQAASDLPHVRLVAQAVLGEDALKISLI